MGKAAVCRVTTKIFLLAAVVLSFLALAVVLDNQPVDAHDCAKHKDQSHQHCGGDPGGDPGGGQGVIATCQELFGVVECSCEFLVQIAPEAPPVHWMTLQGDCFTDDPLALGTNSVIDVPDGTKRTTLIGAGHTIHATGAGMSSVITNATPPASFPVIGGGSVQINEVNTNNLNIELDTHLDPGGAAVLFQGDGAAGVLDFAGSRNLNIDDVDGDGSAEFGVLIRDLATGEPVRLGASVGSGVDAAVGIQIENLAGAIITSNTVEAPDAPIGGVGTGISFVNVTRGEVGGVIPVSLLEQNSLVGDFDFGIDIVTAAATDGDEVVEIKNNRFIRDTDDSNGESIGIRCDDPDGVGVHIVTNNKFRRDKYGTETNC
jgi:hypothetical protein